MTPHFTNGENILVLADVCVTLLNLEYAGVGPGEARGLDVGVVLVDQRDAGIRNN